MNKNLMLRICNAAFCPVLLFCIAFYLCACGGGGGDGAPQLVSLSILPEVESVTVGDSVQLYAQGTYSNDETKDLTAEVTWTCSEEQLAIIENGGENAGRLTAQSAGDVTVNASSGDIHVSMGLTIKISTWTVSVAGENALEAACIRQTSEGGYILSGRAQQADLSWDVYLAKLDASGTILWEKTYDGLGDDMGEGVVEAGGYYFVAGQTASETTSDIYLLCTDQDGNLQWEKTFGGSLEDLATSIQTTDDGNLIIAGGSESPNTAIGNNDTNWDIYLLKTDMDGIMLWESTMTGIDDELPESVASDEIARSVRQTSDGGYVIASSYENSSTFGDFLIVRTDGNGNLVWYRTDGDSWAYEGAEDVLETASGEFLAVGYESDTYGGPSFLGCKMVQMDGDGNKLWESYYETLTSEAKSAIVPQTNGTGFVVATDSRDYSFSDVDLLLFGIDETGSVLWERSYGETSGNRFMSLDQTNDGGYILAGNSVIEEKNTVLIVKVDGNGEF